MEAVFPVFLRLPAARCASSEVARLRRANRRPPRVARARSRRFARGDPRDRGVGTCRARRPRSSRVRRHRRRRRVARHLGHQRSRRQSTRCRCLLRPRIFVCAVDDPASASMFFGSVVRRPPFVIALSSEGELPGLTRLVREVIEQSLPSQDWITTARQLRRDCKDTKTPMGRSPASSNSCERSRNRARRRSDRSPR